MTTSWSMLTGRMKSVAPTTETDQRSPTVLLGAVEEDPVEGNDSPGDAEKGAPMVMARPSSMAEVRAAETYPMSASVVTGTTT